MSQQESFQVTVKISVDTGERRTSIIGRHIVPVWCLETKKTFIFVFIFSRKKIIQEEQCVRFCCAFIQAFSQSNVFILTWECLYCCCDSKNWSEKRLHQAVLQNYLSAIAAACSSNSSNRCFKACGLCKHSFFCLQVPLQSRRRPWSTISAADTWHNLPLTRTGVCRPSQQLYPVIYLLQGRVDRPFTPSSARGVLHLSSC